VVSLCALVPCWLHMIDLNPRVVDVVWRDIKTNERYIYGDWPVLYICFLFLLDVVSLLLRTALHDR
jgi:hypothetical protein